MTSEEFSEAAFGAEPSAEVVEFETVILAEFVDVSSLNKWDEATKDEGGLLMV